MIYVNIIVYHHTHVCAIHDYYDLIMCLITCIIYHVIVSSYHVIIPFSHVPDEPIPIDNEIVLTVDPDTLTAFTACVNWTVTSENMEFRLQVKLLGK